MKSELKRIAHQTGVCPTCGFERRNNGQNAVLHCVLSDIADQVEWHGQKLSIDVWKRLCTAAWLRENKQSPMMIPALDGHGFDVIFQKTSKLSKKQCSELVEWCLAFGSENGVKFSASPADLELMR